VLYHSSFFYLQSGTTIVSDQWAAYGGVDRLLQGSHVTVNHSQHYVHPRHSAVHTNTVERFWKGIKDSVHSFQETVVESHVLTACFRHQFMETPFDGQNPNLRRTIKCPGELLDIMMETVALVYPGLGLPELHIPPRILLRHDAHPYPHLVFYAYIQIRHLFLLVVFMHYRVL
jgi:ISXO2-like transposase domain